MDIVDQTMHAAAFASGATPAAAFLAGLATSFGPCIAPRFVAICGLTDGGDARTRISRTGSFISGLIFSYAVLAFQARMLAQLANFSCAVDIAVAIAFASFGFVTIIRAEQAHCSHSTRVRSVSVGGAFLLGASFAFILSPCCTPILSGLAMLTSATGNFVTTIEVVAAFAAGHAAPLLLAATSAQRIRRAFALPGIRTAVNTIAGGLMLAMGAYFAVLA